MTITKYDSLLVAVAEGTQAFVERDTYKASYEAVKKEVSRKEAVIVSQIEKNKVCYALTDSLTAQMRAKDEIISVQDNTIKRLGTRPKYWQIGIGAGYGFDLGPGFVPGIKAGIFITRQLIKF